MDFSGGVTLAKLGVLKYMSQLDRVLKDWGVERKEVIIKRDLNYPISHVYVSYDTKQRIDLHSTKTELNTLADAFASRAMRGVHPTVRFSSNIEKLIQKYPEKAAALDSAYRKALVHQLRQQLAAETRKIECQIGGIVEAKLGSGQIARPLENGAI